MYSKHPNNPPEKYDIKLTMENQLSLTLCTNQVTASLPSSWVLWFIVATRKPPVTPRGLPIVKVLSKKEATLMYIICINDSTINK